MKEFYNFFHISIRILILQNVLHLKKKCSNSEGDRMFIFVLWFEKKWNIVWKSWNVFYSFKVKYIFWKLSEKSEIFGLVFMTFWKKLQLQERMDIISGSWMKVHLKVHRKKGHYCHSVVNRSFKIWFPVLFCTNLITSVRLNSLLLKKGLYRKPWGLLVENSIKTGWEMLVWNFVQIN